MDIWTDKQTIIHTTVNELFNSVCLSVCVCLSISVCVSLCLSVCLPLLVKCPFSSFTLSLSLSRFPLPLHTLHVYAWEQDTWWTVDSAERGLSYVIAKFEASHQNTMLCAAVYWLGVSTAVTGPSSTRQLSSLWITHRQLFMIKQFCLSTYEQLFLSTLG